MKRPYLPDRGDIVWTNVNPSAGHEQAKKRPALVLSPAAFNRKFKLALVAPITSTIRRHGFEVLLEECGTTGAILCQQVRTIDFAARGIAFIEAAPPSIVADALAKVRALLS